VNLTNAAEAKDESECAFADTVSVTPNFQQLIEAISQAEDMGYACVARDGMVTTANQQFVEHLVNPNSDAGLYRAGGLTLETFITKVEIRLDGDKAPLSHEDVFERLETIFKAAEAGHAPPKHKLIAVTTTGRNISLNCFVISPDFMLLSARDVTAHNRYNRLFDISMQAANAGFWSVDFRTGKFTYSESVLERLTEKEIEKMKTMGIWAIVHPDDREQIVVQWQNIFEKGKDFALKYRVKTEREGVMWQQTTGQVERGPDGQVLTATGFVIDITRDVENQTKLLQEQETSRAKSDFLARMSHEIRTPLNAIIGMSDSLRDENLTPDVRGVVNDIEDAAEGLNNLLSRTLEHAKLMSKKVQINLEAVNPKSVLETCQRLWRPQITSKGLKFKIAIDPNLPETLELDEFRIQQCVNNLLSNAVKFTSEGSISLIMKMAEMKGSQRLIIAVRDQGIGMSPEEAGRIFEDFTQADESISREFGGTGLGMSITKQLSELMGGKVHVKSEKGAGTTAMLILPIAAPQIESPAKKITAKLTSGLKSEPRPVISSKPPHKIKKPFEGLNVLCVEDNQVNQKVVNRLIGNRVNQIHFADNGREALNILNMAPIDVVLMDIHMPIMDGIETTMEIRRSNSAFANVIIIALTADPDYQQKRICKNIGMDDTIGKPVRREDILKAFDRNLGRLSESFGQKVEISA